MMKRFFACMMILLLLCSAALAEPRYPERKAVVCDNAAVFSASINSDLNTMNRMLDDLRIYVVTVDFLDGEALTAYGEGLRDRWRLRDEDLLLLVAVGEDKYGFFPGSGWFSQSALDKLLTAHFAQPFLQQDYDGAIAALMPALAEQISRVYGQQLDLNGLFGSTAALSGDAWMQNTMDRIARGNGDRDTRVSHEESKSGTTFWLVPVLVVVLVLFGNRKSRYYRGRRFPVCSLLVGFGLWRHWGRK